MNRTLRAAAPIALLFSGLSAAQNNPAPSAQTPAVSAPKAALRITQDHIDALNRVTPLLDRLYSGRNINVKGYANMALHGKTPVQQANGFQTLVSFALNNEHQQDGLLLAQAAAILDPSERNKGSYSWALLCNGPWRDEPVVKNAVAVAKQMGMKGPFFQREFHFDSVNGFVGPIPEGFISP